MTQRNKLEISFRTNLAKLTGSAVRINSKKSMGKKTMKEKKVEVATAGCEPAPLCDSHCLNLMEMYLS